MKKNPATTWSITRGDNDGGDDDEDGQIDQDGRDNAINDITLRKRTMRKITTREIKPDRRCRDAVSDRKSQSSNNNNNNTVKEANKARQVRICRRWKRTNANKREWQPEEQEMMAKISRTERSEARRGKMSTSLDFRIERGRGRCR